MLLLGLRLAVQVLDTPLTANVRRLAFADRAVLNLADVSRTLLLTGSGVERDSDVPPADLYYLPPR